MPVLQWLTREQDLRAAGNAPYRLLNEAGQYGDPTASNMLIQGDNLDALKALLPCYAGKVKCIYIDPPYNTHYAFDHYDDNLEHTQWLSILYPRLELLHDLLRNDGVLWISIDDDDESHYLKVCCDEIFGRKNFIRNVVWQKRTSPDARLNLGDAHEHILVYGRDIHVCKDHLYKIRLNDSRTKDYKNLDDDPRGPWASVDCTGQVGHATENQFYEIEIPSGDIIKPPKNRCWALSQDTFNSLRDDNRIWFGVNGNSRPRIKKILSETEGGNAWSWWENTEVGHYQESKKEMLSLFTEENSSIFETPKPERLISRILEISTKPGDLVLDSFLGSGTTAAVAHKMGRRYIGVEIGEHAVTHCIPRLQKVIEGEQGGISGAVNWQGGGGFRFYTLGEAVFAADGSIRPDVTFHQLAAHVWFVETGVSLSCQPDSPLLGVYEGTGYYLLYNGILGDRSAAGGNVLTKRVLGMLPQHDGPKVVYGERSMFGPQRLKAMGITFKHMPYDIKGK